MRTRTTRTSGRLWTAILIIWAIASAILVWRFLPHLVPGPAFPVLLFLLAALCYFVLTGIFNVAVNLTSHLLRERAPVGGVTHRPRVAMFLCTYNDFDRSAAESLWRLTYSAVELWVLDDSTDAAVRKRVDDFAKDSAAHGRPVRVERRGDRKGFKAGAINNALTLLSPEVEFVGIVDSDEIVTPRFIEGCLAHFTADDIAFVQANHRCYNTGGSWWTRYLGVGVDLHWRHYQRYRNTMGTVNMLGHGALVRRSALEAVGGFPGVTCEDLAFTVEAKMKAFHGAFAADVVCGETFPEDFAAMRRRHLRWSWATVEFLKMYLVPLVRSRVAWHEKLDLLLPSINLPAVFVLLGFLLASYGLTWTGMSLPVFGDPIVIALGVFSSLAPLAMFVDLFRRPGFAIKVLIVNTLAYLALFPVSAVGVLRGLVRRAEFLVTPKGGGDRLTYRRAVSELRVDLAFGGFLLAAGFVTFGPWGLLSPLALACVLAPVLFVTSRRALVPTRDASAPALAVNMAAILKE